MTSPPTTPLPLTISLFRPGMRVAVAVSGGADSVALLRALLELRASLGIVLSVAHLHHGIRGLDADADAVFVTDLAARYDLPLHLHHVDTPAAAREHRETLEEAARNLRYAWFRVLLAQGDADTVATAHTLDDQAETVLLKLLRGAWTEGLGGIHPTLEAPPGLILRPMLAVRRDAIETYLHAIDQPWREDASNLDSAHTRNRLRHHLLPILAEYNPQIRPQLAHLATIARDEDSYWHAELARLLPSLLLTGKPVRGGGRATTTLPGQDSVAIEIERLRPLLPAVRRRVLRAAADRLGHSIDFDQTERLLTLCGFAPRLTSGLGAFCESGTPSPRRLDLASGLVAERNHRELLMSNYSPTPAVIAPDLAELRLEIPGEVFAPAYALHLCAQVLAPGIVYPAATLRPWRAGDRVQIRYSRGPRKVKEVLQRILAANPLRPGPPRATWPVLEWQGEIIWMLGSDVFSPVAVAAGITLSARALHDPPTLPEVDAGTQNGPSS